MEDFLERMRHKKNKDKRSFALLWTTLITGGIFIVWLATIGATWDSRFAGKDLIPTELIKEFSEQQAAIIESQNDSQFDIEWNLQSTTTSATTTAE